MFCYQCGERLWNGRNACHKCGTVLPGAGLEARGSTAACSWWGGYVLAASLTAAVVFGGLALRYHRELSRENTAKEPGDLITPMNVRDPASLVMAPHVYPPATAAPTPSPPPEKKVGRARDE